MAIDITKALFDKKDSTFERFDMNTLTWGRVPKGKYNATLVASYPWKKFKADSDVRLKDDDGRYLRNDDNSYITEVHKDLEWTMSDLVFRIDGGKYHGYAVRGSLSTHPNYFGTAKQFMYLAGLMDVPLSDVFKHTGKVSVAINTYERSYDKVDPNTGETETIYTPTVSYFEAFDHDIVSENELYNMENDNSDDVLGL